VIYADTDAMGIVYHTNYLRWFEVGRTELLREIGITHESMADTFLLLPVSRISCHYLSPARIDEVLTIETDIAWLRRASLKFQYEIWDAERRTKRAEGHTVHACTDGNGRIVRLPEFCVRQILLTRPHLKGERHGG